MRYKRVLLVALLAALVTISVIALPSEATSSGATRVIIQARNYDRALATVSKYGRVISTIPEIKAIVAEIPSDVAKKIRGLITDVVNVEEDKLAYKAVGEVQWDIQYIYAPNVWSTYYQYVGDAAYG